MLSLHDIGYFHYHGISTTLVLYGMLSLILSLVLSGVLVSHLDREIGPKSRTLIGTLAAGIGACFVIPAVVILTYF